jgi:sirohydrochlorin ferrochelatase
LLEQFHQQSKEQRTSDAMAKLLCSEQTGVLLLGHGSRRAEANQEWEQIWQMFQRMHPQLKVQRGYVEFFHPSLEEGVDLLRQQYDVHTVVIVPLFLTTGNHLCQHVPIKVDALKEKYPDISFVLTEHIGADSLLLQIIEKRIRTTGLLEQSEGD